MPDPIMDNPQATGDAGNAASKSLTDIVGTGTAQPNAEPSAGGDKAAGTNAAQSQQDQDLPSWTSQLSDEIRNNADTMKQLAKFKKIGDLASSYAALETKIGRSIVQPGKDAKPEEVQAFYEKLGKPKEAAKYGIEDKDAEAFKTLAFSHNLTDEQARGLWAGMKEVGSNLLQTQQAQAAQHIKEVDAKLHQEYGNRYGEKMTMLERGIRTFAGAETGKKLRETGLMFDEGIIKMFVQLGELSAEAGTSMKGGPGGGSYKSTADGGTFSFNGLKQ